MRSPTSHLNWESKYFSQTMKTVMFNGLISWKLNKSVQLSSSTDDFRIIDTFCDKFNDCKCFPDSIYDETRVICSFSDFFGHCV